MAMVLLGHHLAAHGVEARVHSAGTLGWGGPATENSVAVMAERGLDLSGHESRRLDAGLVVGADLVLGMTETTSPACSSTTRRPSTAPS